MFYSYFMLWYEVQVKKTWGHLPHMLATWVRPYMHHLSLEFFTRTTLGDQAVCLISRITSASTVSWLTNFRYSMLIHLFLCDRLVLWVNICMDNMWHQKVGSIFGMFAWLFLQGCRSAFITDQRVDPVII